MTRVDHIKRYAGTNGVKIGRTTEWGNPFRMNGSSELERARVCREFRRWWYKPAQSALRRRAVKKLTNKVLLCHCAPLPCHGLTIATYVNWVHSHEGSES